MSFSPYLFFSGQCEAAFKFYEQCLGGKLVTMMTHGQMPMADQEAPEARQALAEWSKAGLDGRKAIAHARLIVGGTALMGSDSPPKYSQDLQGFRVSFLAAGPAEAERIFSALAENGAVQMPMEQTSWAVRFGMCVDRFGTPWMISCERAS